MRPERQLGVVRGTADPGKCGSLKVEVKTVVDGAPLGDAWLPGSFPFAGGGDGFFYLPPVGAMVDVEMEAEAGRRVEHVDARWTGARYGRADGAPEPFKSDTQNRGGIKYGDEVFLQDKAAGVTAVISDNVRLGAEDATHPVPLGDTFNARLSTFLDALCAYLDLDVINPGAPTMKAAAVAMKAAANTWLAVKVKAE